MMWMDTVFKLTFIVNNKSYLPLLNSEKKNVQTFALLPINFYSPK